MILRTLYFVFGMAVDAGGKPWSVVHYACLKCAIKRIRPKDGFFCCVYEPKGPWWEVTRKLVICRRSQFREKFSEVS